MAIITARAYGRAALVGNPSDNFPEHGYDGAVLAMSLWHFRTEVQAWESPEINILHSDRAYDGWEQLLEHTARYGIFDEEPYLRAGLSVFGHYCHTHSLTQRLDRNVTVRLASTNIPRQLGLSGSSAIVTATIRALMEFYGITEREIPLLSQGWLILQAEVAARTRGGLQDKLAQAYGAAGHGLVHMEFPAKLHNLPNGQSARCEPLPMSLLPRMALVYYPEGAKQSHAVHARWEVLFRESHPEFIAAVKELPLLAPQAIEVLKKNDVEEFCRIMNRGFDLRLATCGTSKADVEARDFCRRRGFAFNQTGSGGAALLCHPNPKLYDHLEAELPEGWGMLRLSPQDKDRPAS